LMPNGWRNAPLQVQKSVNSFTLFFRHFFQAASLDLSINSIWNQDLKSIKMVKAG
jgi:hypothetical protein